MTTLARGHLRMGSYSEEEVVDPSLAVADRQSPLDGWGSRVWAVLLVEGNRVLVRVLLCDDDVLLAYSVVLASAYRIRLRLADWRVGRIVWSKIRMVRLLASCGIAVKRHELYFPFGANPSAHFAHIA